MDKELHIIVDSGDLDEIANAHSYGIARGTTLNPSHIYNYRKVKGQGFDIIQYVMDVIRKSTNNSEHGPVSLEVIGITEDDMVEQGLRMYERFSPYGKVWIKIPVNPSMDPNNPVTMDGLKAIERLSKRGIPVNCTLIHTPEQALAAAESGAKVVSPFAGRLDDYLRESIGLQLGRDFTKEGYFPSEGLVYNGQRVNYNGIVSGVDLVRLIRTGLDDHEFKDDVYVLAASVRNPRQLEEMACLTGADMATLPFATIQYMRENGINRVPRDRKGPEKDPANVSTYVFDRKRGLYHPKTLEGMIKFDQDGNAVPEYRELFSALQYSQ